MGEDFSNNVAVRAPDDLAVAFSDLLAFFDIDECWWVIAHQNDRDTIKGDVGLPIAATIEPEPVGPSVGCGASCQSIAD